MTKPFSPEYQAALDYIYSFVDFSRTHQENLSPENFDLSRMVQFMDLLGSPQDEFPSLHIAGSKGKGSVSAFCASVLQKAGFQVGLYTSPHLMDFEERIQINQQPMNRDLLVEYVEEIKPAVSQVQGLTTFEIMTGLGFLDFARQGVDIGVIEVGLGGRLDATNVITPRVSIITSLYLDHTSILGDTLEQIAFEKAGIIKPGVPVISAPQEEKAINVIRDIAGKKSARLVEVGRDYTIQPLARSLAGQVFEIQRESDQSAVEFSIPLLGDFQMINAATAYAALDLLSERGISLDEEHILQGFKEVNWPARFEVLREQPPVIVDSAHNPASIGKLRDTIDDFFPDLSLILIFGISEDKQLDGMLDEILPRTTHLITTQADHPRAMDPEELARIADGYGCTIEVVPAVGEALKRGLSLAGEKDLLVVAGSIFVAASARIAWFESS
ncbi:MAG TPA: bifunctional folylpolyglutamate synthase/dihydrofolate synthase [Chloroflexi bacterium]|nr:bifunctional folylpolyglutamate synthase/dihydrofolate synthase [Chloroflexota bacterium]